MTLDSLDVMIALGKITDDREREILFDRLVLERTLQSLALQEGITRERVRQIEVRGRRRLQGLLARRVEFR